MGFELLLLVEEFIDRIIWHDAIMPEKFWSRGRGARHDPKVIMFVPEIQLPGRGRGALPGRYERYDHLRLYDKTLLGLGVFRRFLNREGPVRVVNDHRRRFDRLRGILRARHRGGCKGKNRQ